MSQRTEVGSMPQPMFPEGDTNGVNPCTRTTEVDVVVALGCVVGTDVAGAGALVLAGAVVAAAVVGTAVARAALVGADDAAVVGAALVRADGVAVVGAALVGADGAALVVLAGALVADWLLLFWLQADSPVNATTRTDAKARLRRRITAANGSGRTVVTAAIVHTGREAGSSPAFLTLARIPARVTA
jgi:hypothetical protein